MPDYGLTVEDLGACVRLIDVMLRNLPALGIERRQFDTVYELIGAPGRRGGLLSEREPPRGQVRSPPPRLIVPGMPPELAAALQFAVDAGYTGATPVPPRGGGGGSGEGGGMATGLAARRQYTLLITGIPDSAVVDLERLAGTKLRETTDREPAGKPHTINELLEKILLIRETRSTAANGLMVALMGSSQANVDLARWHAELGRLGCRGMRIAVLAGNEPGLRVLYLIEIAHPPPNFIPPEEWGDRRALVFARLKPEATCPFYIEWGFAHPVRELARLYRISDERLVLMAADALETHRGQGA
jgi:hypothetical protein